MKRDRWSSRTIFLFAAIGSAVGLGNVWRFPYLAGKYGGGAFLIPYILMLIVLGIPLLILEFAIGQRMQLGAVGSFKKIKHKLSGVGFAAVFCGFIVCSYYTVVMAWSVLYLIFSPTTAWGEDTKTFFLQKVLHRSANAGEVGLKPLNMARHYGRLLENSGTERIKYRLDIGGGLHSSVDLNGDGKIDPKTKEVIDYIQEVIDVWNCSGKWIEPEHLNMRQGEDRWTDVWFYNGYPPAVGTMMINGESLGFRTWQWIVWKYRLSLPTGSLQPQAPRP